MFANPLKILKSVGLREDDIVADLGAGTGHYSILAGGLVTRGKVYAVELQKDFLDKIEHNIKDSHLSNVEIIWGNIESGGGTKLGAGIIDVAIASNILFQVENKDQLIEEINRILKSGGKVLLVDWSDASVIKKIIPKAIARELFEEKGFLFDSEIDAGSHHYGMILTKK